MSTSLEYLARRSDLFSALRLFFLEQDFVEVETPLLSKEVIPELHIEPMRVRNTVSPGSDSTNRTAQWLQASPELHMKRLVCQGLEAIFQITRSFRSDERGPLHNSEFTIVEWYRVGDDMQAGIELVDKLLQSLLATGPAMRTSYAEAFEKYVGVDPHQATPEQLASRAAELDLTVPGGMRTDDRDEWLNFLLALKVEPELGRAGPEMLYDYPHSQAALARIALREDGQRVAERFELYWHGVELANGYHELTVAKELRNRLAEVNKAREADERARLPMPESLLTEIERGLPACTGCALGFDRLVMLVCGTDSIDEVIAFPDE